MEEFVNFVRKLHTEEENVVNVENENIIQTDYN